MEPKELFSALRLPGRSIVQALAVMVAAVIGAAILIGLMGCATTPTNAAQPALAPQVQAQARIANAAYQVGVLDVQLAALRDVQKNAEAQPRPADSKAADARAEAIGAIKAKIAERQAAHDALVAQIRAVLAPAGGAK